MCDDNLQQHMDLIKKALVKIDEKYFKIKGYGIEQEKVRERVFCYELYHQIRSIQHCDDSMTLNGEIDKKGYPEFNNENPDFVFHVPGTSKNYIVIEVKGSLDTTGMQKDIKTLTKFVADHNYKKGIYIIYGNSLDTIKGKMKQIELASDIKDNLNEVYRQIDVVIIEMAQNADSIQIKNIKELIEN